MEAINILITGGCGYIGSHTVIELANNTDYNITIIDNLSNSSISSIDKIKNITGKSISFYNIDINDEETIDLLFKKSNFNTVIHLASLKSVKDSISNPLLYYTKNVSGALVILNTMKKYGCKNMIFSSSATVYGTPERVPIKEDDNINPNNPYGSSKYFIEQILRDFSYSDSSMNITSLRYFNPVGCHHSGIIGEEDNDTPNNLCPYILKVASGQLPFLSIFGNDYNTPDGTAIRDYIHVTDIAKGHVSALKFMRNGFNVYNLGRGVGYSVLQMVKAMEKASGVEIKYTFSGRREGDVDVCYSDPTKALNELGWSAHLDIERMCEDSWRWKCFSVINKL